VDTRRVVELHKVAWRNHPDGIERPMTEIPSGVDSGYRKPLDVHPNAGNHRPAFGLGLLCWEYLCAKGRRALVLSEILMPQQADQGFILRAIRPVKAARSKKQKRADATSKPSSRRLQADSHLEMPIVLSSRSKSGPPSSMLTPSVSRSRSSTSKSHGSGVRHPQEGRETWTSALAPAMDAR